jgi:hypothetical protein
MKMSLNVGGIDRAVRFILGIVLIALAYFGVLTGTAAIIAYVVAAIALVTGLMRFCPANALFGINTHKKKVSISGE